MAEKKNTAPVEETTAPVEETTAPVEETTAPVEETTAPVVAEEPAAEKMVTIKIPRVKKDQPDTFVSVNERTWQIKPGVAVEVPECVAEVIRHREEMLEEIMAFEEAHAK